MPGTRAPERAQGIRSLATPRPWSGPVETAVRGARRRRLRVRGSTGAVRPAGAWALDGIDLDLPPGGGSAVVGPSGAGKSTVAAVLLRFLPYEGGSVTLDGVELAALTGEDVRRVVGLAAQDTHVFDTTLRENLLLARREATEAELRTALERARLWTGWTSYQTVSTPRSASTAPACPGVNGSAWASPASAGRFPGPRPRRARRAPGHADRRRADADLVELTRGQTTVMITHRLAGLETMDEIIVLDAGRVVERGTHAS